MMKIFILVIILFGIALQNICSAQNSFPTLGDHPKWRVLEYIVYIYSPKYFIDYTYEKDTLINDLNYSIVTRSDSSNNVPKSYRIGYTRTLGEKVYFKFIDGMEYMIYNFGLKVGESSYCYMCGIGLDKYTALKVDTITIEGIKRKRIQVDAESLSGYPSYWIEGIGSNLNPFLYYCSGVQDELRCTTLNSTLIYLDPQANDCSTITGIEPNPTSNKFRIYPNPVDNVLFIKSSSSSDENAVIYDCLGIVKERLYIQNNYKELNISNYQKGIYFVRIGSNVSRFIKQ